MKKILVYGLTLIGGAAFASTPTYHVMHVLQTATGAYIANPTVANQWLAVDDTTSSCRVLGAQSEDRNGASLRAADGSETFVSDWAVVYTRPDAKSAWTVVTDGSWIESGDELAWSHLQFHKTGDVNPLLHHFLWQSGEQTFINDPRPGDNFYYQNPQHGKTWYRADAQGNCEVLTEKAREYGEPNLQSVTLTGKSSTWTVETGRASNGSTEVLGDWLGR